MHSNAFEIEIAIYTSMSNNKFKKETLFIHINIHVGINILLSRSLKDPMNKGLDILRAKQGCCKGVFEEATGRILKRNE